MTATLPERLLAKGHRSSRAPLSLEQHLFETDQAAVALFGPGRRWARSFCRFFKLGEDLDTFLLNLRLAALFHDIGKANEDFLRAMLAKGFERQTLRHEHISALILHLPSVRGWLSQNPRIDLEAVTAAVLSHHLKAGPPGDDYAWAQPRAHRRSVELFLKHAEIDATFSRIASLAALEGPLPVLPSSSLEFRDQRLSEPWGRALQDGLRATNPYRRKLKKDPTRLGLLLAVKAGLIAADSVASALFREQKRIDAWVSTAMLDPLSPQQLETAIIRPRLRSIHPEAQLKDFQREVARRGPRALLLAACGSGKTLAAWAWAKAQLDSFELGRVLFLYPTRGTATEGYRDYVGWAPEGEADLMHGSAAYELQEMARNPPESIAGKRTYDEAVERLYSLAHWPKRYVSATTDQFLSFLEHRYGGLCMVPVIADSAIVIDEVHSYDDAMFRSLLSFLRHFDGPVLCMTATLPAGRQRQLEECGLEVFPDSSASVELRELRAAETRTRYQIETLTRESEADEIAVDGFRAGERVLFVVNTVNRCQETAERLAAQLRHEVLVYHSRFRLMDRKRAHEATVAAFQQRTKPVLAVTTQVCEMSLDIDADLLITEYAPVTSLVQRFGRANRKGLRGLGKLFVLTPSSPRPYGEEELAEGRSLIAALSGRPISQADLAAALLEHAGERPKVDEYASFVSSGYYARPGDFREIDEFTQTAILDSDLEMVKELSRHHRPLDAFLVPVPRRGVETEDPPSQLPPYLRVASAQQYSPYLGFLSSRGAT
ncbi:MAG: CRISPR-associated helicase Cas3' [Myxococcota bacterium]